MAHFVIGTALGNIALIYDQGSIISPSDDLSNPVPPVLVSADSLMRYALRELDSAMHYDSLGTSQWSECRRPQLVRQSWPRSVAGQHGPLDAGLQGRASSQVSRAPPLTARTRPPCSAHRPTWANIISWSTAFLAKWPNGVQLKTLPAQGWDIGYFSTIFQANQQSWSMMWQFIMGPGRHQRRLRDLDRGGE